MYSKLGTGVAILLAAFPFLALGYKMFEDSMTGIIVYVVLLVILLVGLLLGPRLNLAALATETDERPVREPSPPIEWSWEGVNRPTNEEKE